MKPTVYLPHADLCPTGLRRASASSVVRFGAGEATEQRLWTQTEGQMVGRIDQRTQSAGGSGKKRTP